MIKPKFITEILNKSQYCLKDWAELKVFFYMINTINSSSCVMTPFPQIHFNKKGASNNGRNPLTLCFTNSLSKYMSYHWRCHSLYQWRNHRLYQWSNHRSYQRRKNTIFLFSFISCCTVSVVPSINRPEFSSDFTILIK